MQGLSCIDAQGTSPATQKLVAAFMDDSRENDEIIATAKAMLDSALEYRDQCDELLTRHAKHWSLGRLALVDRNILRLGVCEFLLNKEPHKVIISEALSLAKEFSSAESPRFINGVLDAIVREIKAEISDE